MGAPANTSHQLAGKEEKAKKKKFSEQNERIYILILKRSTVTDVIIMYNKL